VGRAAAFHVSGIPTTRPLWLLYSDAKQYREAAHRRKMISGCPGMVAFMMLVPSLSVVGQFEFLTFFPRDHGDWLGNRRINHYD